MKYFLKQKNKGLTCRSMTDGFTLVEALVAIAIFTLSVTAVMSIISKSVGDTGYAKNKIIAGYLAQEGVEYIRNIRDTYILNDPLNGWSSFKVKISPCGTPASALSCYFDEQGLDFTPGVDKAITAVSITTCSSTCPNLYYSSLTGIYDYNQVGSVATPFIRKIEITYPDGITANEAKVTSTVTWSQGSGTYRIVLAENLFNWTE